MKKKPFYESAWSTPPLKYFKLTPEAFAPEWGTDHAACFDLKACLQEDTKVKMFTLENRKFDAQPELGKFLDSETIDEANYERIGVLLEPGDRMLIPTGLILNIPLGYSVRLHSRSGLAFKQGLVLANHEGVIDSDYIDPTFILLTNTSTKIQYIFHGDRIAQGEMIPDLSYDVIETPNKPTQKTDRQGGFGSTGLQ